MRTPQPNDGNYTRLPSIFELAQVYLGDQRGKWIRSYRSGNIPEVERKTLTHSSSKAFINPPKTTAASMPMTFNLFGADCCCLTLL